MISDKATELPIQRLHTYVVLSHFTSKAGSSPRGPGSGEYAFQSCGSAIYHAGSKVIKIPCSKPEGMSLESHHLEEVLTG